MSADPHTIEFEPIQLVAIVKEGVGQPRNDGTPGSGLYRVPVRLSRKPSAGWGEFLVRCWNSPPSFTTMHRPGIASVQSDTVVLDGTTVEEFEKYHLETLKLCVGVANDAETERLEQERQRREREEAARLQHERHVDEVVDRIDFDSDEE